jgi:hypothetical protein
MDSLTFIGFPRQCYSIDGYRSKNETLTEILNQEEVFYYQQPNSRESSVTCDQHFRHSFVTRLNLPLDLSLASLSVFFFQPLHSPPSIHPLHFYVVFSLPLLCFTLHSISIPLSRKRSSILLTRRQQASEVTSHL